MKKLLLAIFNPKFPINQLFISVIGFIFAQIVFFWSTWVRIFHYFPYNLDYSFDLLKLSGCLIFYLVLANVLPYLFIKLKMVSSDSSSAFIGHYFKAVLIWSVFVTWLVFFFGDETSINIYKSIGYWLPTFAAFMIYKKFSK